MIMDKQKENIKFWLAISLIALYVLFNIVEAIAGLYEKDFFDDKFLSQSWYGALLGVAVFFPDVVKDIINYWFNKNKQD